MLSEEEEKAINFLKEFDEQIYNALNVLFGLIEKQKELLHMYETYTTFTVEDIENMAKNDK